jgi:hypothetical protein
LQAGGWVQAVRFAGGVGSEDWPFWVDLDPIGVLRIQLAVTYWRRDEAIDAFVAKTLPPWTTVMPGITYLSEWSF